MNHMFSGLADYLSHSDEQAGALPAAYSTFLDGLCAALAATISPAGLHAAFSAQVIQGLLAVQEIDRASANAGLPADGGAWTYSLQPTPFGAASLTLKRIAPQAASLYTQLDREYRLHGLFILVLGSGPDEQLLSFDLEQQPDGWYLRRWEANRQVPFRLEVPAGQALPWSSTGISDLWAKILPASVSQGIDTLFQVISSPGTAAPEVPPPASDQTLVAPQSEIEQPGLCLVNQANGELYPLKSHLTIGRSENNDLQLDDREMSRNHAVIEPLAGGWQIQDLNSTNGTWLNDMRVFGSTLLKAGDSLRFGNTHFRLESPDNPSSN